MPKSQYTSDLGAFLHGKIRNLAHQDRNVEGLHGRRRGMGKSWITALVCFYSNPYCLVHGVEPMSASKETVLPAFYSPRRGKEREKTEESEFLLKRKSSVYNINIQLAMETEGIQCSKNIIQVQQNLRR